MFHPTTVPSPMAGKEKVRDWERSKESTNNQLARREGEEIGEEQKKVKDRERSEEPKSNQLTKRMGENETDEGEEQKWTQFTEVWSWGKEQGRQRQRQK